MYGSERKLCEVSKRGSYKVELQIFMNSNFKIKTWNTDLSLVMGSNIISTRTYVEIDKENKETLYKQQHSYKMLTKCPLQLI